jgi:uncharacterized membrane protein
MNDVPAAANPGEITPNDRLFGALCYAVGVFVPAFVLLSDEYKARPFLRYHAVQSLGLSVAAFSSIIILCILGTVINIIPLVGQIISLLITCVLGVGSIAIFGLVIWYAVRAYNGEQFEVPVITKFVRDQGWL